MDSLTDAVLDWIFDDEPVFHSEPKPQRHDDRSRHLHVESLEDRNLLAVLGDSLAPIPSDSSSSDPTSTSQFANGDGGSGTSDGSNSGSGIDSGTGSDSTTGADGNDNGSTTGDNSGIDSGNSVDNSAFQNGVRPDLVGTSADPNSVNSTGTQFFVNGGAGGSVANAATTVGPDNQPFQNLVRPEDAATLTSPNFNSREQSPLGLVSPNATGSATAVVNVDPLGISTIDLDNTLGSRAPAGSVTGSIFTPFVQSTDATRFEANDDAIVELEEGHSVDDALPFALNGTAADSIAYTGLPIVDASPLSNVPLTDGAPLAASIAPLVEAREETNRATSPVAQLSLAVAVLGLSFSDAAANAIHPPVPKQTHHHDHHDHRDDDDSESDDDFGAAAGENRLTANANASDAIYAGMGA